MPCPLRDRSRRLHRMLVMPCSSGRSLPRHESWRAARYPVQRCLEQGEGRRSHKPLFGFVAAREQEKRFLLVSSGEEQTRFPLCRSCPSLVSLLLASAGSSHSACSSSENQIKLSRPEFVSSSRRSLNLEIESRSCSHCTSASSSSLKHCSPSQVRARQPHHRMRMAPTSATRFVGGAGASASQQGRSRRRSQGARGGAKLATQTLAIHPLPTGRLRAWQRGCMRAIRAWGPRLRGRASSYIPSITNDASDTQIRRQAGEGGVYSFRRCKTSSLSPVPAITRNLRGAPPHLGSSAVM